MFKNISLRVVAVILLILFGIIYALPNLYPEVPALQISAKSTQGLAADIPAKVAADLKSAKLSHLPAVASDRVKDRLSGVTQSMWVQFHDTDTQLQARDVLQSALGKQYSVVASLRATTPAWLQAIGAHPMSLGLDLRGGIHFLLYVDIQSMLKERLQGDIHAMGTNLRQQDIRYSGISHYTSENDMQGVKIAFRQESDLQQAETYLHKNFPDYVFSKVPQTTTLAITGVLSPTALQGIHRYTMEQTITILTNRVNALGVAEASITQQGADHISVDLPGIQDPARARDMIGKVASLKFQLVDTQQDAAAAAASSVIPFGTQLYHYHGQPILVKDNVILKGSNIVSASAGTDQMGQPSVNVRLGSGEVSFHRITGQNVGKPMAVIYVESIPHLSMQNGKEVTKLEQKAKVISVATIQSALPNTFQITGLESQRYANDLALQLRSGAYVAPISIVRNLVVGSTMGKSNIDKGVMSTLIGFILVVAFMACYYRVFGLVASFALFLNVIFIMALLSLLGATLTLPGIAGIVLTMGMAVDANVLINERIREELRRGVSPLASIKAGYERAFATIVDANVTTLIVAVILFALSSTSVKSFAINLMIGLITSMITAIFFTRTFINMIYGQRTVKHLSIGIRLQKRGK